MAHPSHQVSDLKKRNIIISVVAVVVVLVIGYALINSRASGFFSVIDPSGTTVSGNATLVNDASLPGGKALQFNAPTTPPPTTPPPTTPPPTTGLKGWQLTPTSVGLAPHGLSCATLPEYNGPVSNGNFKPAAGSVISGVRISRPMNLSNGNITIEKSCIKGNGIINGQGMVVTWEPDGCGNQCSPARGPVTIRDSEFDGSTISTQAVAYGCALHGLATLERNYVHDLGSGFCFVNTGNQYSGSMIGNYIHKLRGYGNPAGTGSHNETGTIRDFPTNVNPNRKIDVFNNYMDATGAGSNQTGAFFIQTIYGEIDNVYLEGNLLQSGSYNLGLEVHGASKDKFGRNMKANNNRFFGWSYGNPGYVNGNGVVNYGWAEAKDNYKNDPSKPDNRGPAVSIN